MGGSFAALALAMRSVSQVCKQRCRQDAVPTKLDNLFLENPQGTEVFQLRETSLWILCFTPLFYEFNSVHPAIR